jgi:hypothetical protein
MVTAPDGIMLRVAPSQKAKRTGIMLQAGELFLVKDIVTACAEPRVDDDGLTHWKHRPTDEPCFLHLADGRGWVLDRHPASQEHSVERYEPHVKGCRAYRQRARGMFLTTAWEYFMMCFIIINAVFIGLEIDHPDIMSHEYWLIVNSFFALCYLLEMVVKLTVFGFKEFLRSYWNVYDLLVTSITLVGDCIVIIMFFVQPHGDRSGLSAVIPVLRLLRLLRIARLFSQLRLLLSSLASSLGPLSWIALFICLWFYICACLTTVFIGRPDMLKDSQVKEAPKLRAMFKDIRSSMYTLFEVMMMEGWIEVVRPLVGHRPFLVIFFLLFVFLSAFFLLNLVTSVVVDRTMQAKQDDDENVESVQEDLRVGRIGELCKELLKLNGNEDLFKPEKLTEWEQEEQIDRWLDILEWDGAFLQSLCELLDHKESGEVSMKAMRDLCICYGMPFSTETYMRVQIQVVRRMQQLTTIRKQLQPQKSGLPS